MENNKGWGGRGSGGGEDKEGSKKLMLNFEETFFILHTQGH